MNSVFNALKTFNFIIIILFLISNSSVSQSKSKNERNIHGKLLLDSIWGSAVYLSHIPTFDDMYTMSNAMIIAETTIDSLGNFKFPTSILPEEDNLFRLHISKKEAPAASLIIGGKEENHIFFIANNRTSINIKNEKRSDLFGDYTISGYYPNSSLQKINKIISHNDSIHTYLSSVKKEFIIKTNNERLRHIADTSSHPIVSIYALHNSQFESTFLANREFFKTYLKKWENDDSTYFKELRSKLPQEETSKTLWYLIFGSGFFVLGMVLSYYYTSRRNKNSNQLKSLSIQERKIFHLIQSGKSNKEISEEYNIGLSTVKSHVSNIYSKLNLKSRKEAIDFK